MYILFAIIDKACEGPLAGVIEARECSPVLMKIVIACVVLFSTFQRTHVTTNPVGLLRLPQLLHRVCARARGRWGLKRRARC
ncbi:hypothetical protein BJV74DRAFT_865486, partial [Russula compacta]